MYMYVDFYGTNYTFRVFVQTKGDSKFPSSQMYYQELQNAVFKCFHSLRAKSKPKLHDSCLEKVIGRVPNPTPPLTSPTTHKDSSDIYKHPDDPKG